MSVNQSNNNLSYGLRNPLQGANPEYIFAKRAPISTDSAPFGTFWFYKVSGTSTQVYIFTSSGTWSQIPFNSGAANFSSLSVSSGISTAPVNSSVATAAFVATLTAGTSVHNTTGYDLMCNIVLIVSSATNATITLGVGAATGPTANTVYPTFSVVSTTMMSFSAVVPNGYYLVYNTTGTITVASVTVQSCPL